MYFSVHLLAISWIKSQSLSFPRLEQRCTVISSEEVSEKRTCTFSGLTKGLRLSMIDMAMLEFTKATPALLHVDKNLIHLCPRFSS